MPGIDPEEVRVAVDGVVSVGVYGATAPTTHSSALAAAWTDLGLVTEDGVTRTTETESEVIRAWQNNQRVRTVITSGEVTFEFVLMQTNADTVGFFHGDEVNPTDGSVVVDPTKERPRIAFNLDIIDGDEVIREYAPNAQVTEVGEQVAVSGTEFGWPVTVTCSFDETLGGATKRWFSSLVVAP